jgi:molecular chaperone GrpE
MTDQEKQVPETETPTDEVKTDEVNAEEVKTEEPQEAPEAETSAPTEADTLKAALAGQEDKFLRLAAEYDNFRRRTQKEKEGIYADATANAVKALLPVYDNLERAMKQDTDDEAYKKGVEMTMAGLRKALESLGVTEIDAVGQSFDPNIHNAVMHVEDEALGQNVVAEVFQAGFKLGDKVIRFAMVKVAN